MPLTRRIFLKTGAATATILVAGGAGWALTRNPRAAREPWRSAAVGFGDARLDALAYAILAPSPHNMQPWQIRLDDEFGMTVFCDLDRRLPQTDPLDRQITIGFGCFLELLRQAAAEKGFLFNIRLFPEGEPQPRLDARPIAKITLEKGPAGAGDVGDPLFEVILDRRTNRLPFDTSKTVHADTLAALATASLRDVAIYTSADPALVGQLRKLTVDGWQVEWSTPRLRRETNVVTRIGKKEINANPDGIILEGPMMEALNLIGAVTREQIDNPESRAWQESLSFYSKACETAMAFVWSITSSNTRLEQIAAGRSWVRTQMIANAAGLAFHPLSQVLQEYPEMDELYRQTHDLLDAEQGEVVQMLARLGYAPKIPPSVRWPLQSRLIAG